MGDAHARASAAVQALATLVCAEKEQAGFLSTEQSLQLGYMAERSGCIDETLESAARLLLHYPENRRLFSTVCVKAHADHWKALFRNTGRECLAFRASLWARCKISLA
jgi:hypothetical protein